MSETQSTHPKWKQDRCEHCAAGLSLGMSPGKHWTGNRNPPPCTAPTAEQYITELESELATATERATKAEAGLSLSVRALEVASKRFYDTGYAASHGKTGDMERICGDCVVGHWDLRAALAEPAILAEAERLKALEKDRGRLDWLQEQTTDTIYLDDGRIVDVKGDSVRGVIDAAIAQAGTEVKP